jgi:D-aspartate ligase
VVVKPASFAAWNETGVSAARNKKALIIDEASDLLDLYSKLYAENPSQLVQEFVVGPDNLHYDVLLYIDDKGKLLGSFSARKPRVSPPHAGTGCYIESQRLPGLIDDSFEYCRRLGYSGLANLQYKRDQRTGEFLLLEINPRLVEWNIFAARCGVNLAKLAYMGVLGQPVSALQNQIAPRFFCNMRKDLPAMRALVKEGLLTPLDCGRSIIRPGISFQLWDRRDPNPFLQKLKVAIGKRLGFAHAKP